LIFLKGIFKLGYLTTFDILPDDLISAD